MNSGELQTGRFNADNVAERVGISLDESFRVLDRLERAGYIELARRAAGGTGRSMRVEHIEQRGLRAVGVWPAAELDYAQLLELIEALREESTPEDDSKWRRLAEGFAGAGRDIAVQFLAALARQSAGIG